MHINIPMGIKLNLEESMMFIAKFNYFLYKFSFVQLKQGHRTDLWYQISKI